MKQKEIKALMVAPKEYPKVVTLKTDLDSLQKAVSIGASYQGLILISNKTDWPFYYAAHKRHGGKAAEKCRVILFLPPKAVQDTYPAIKWFSNHFIKKQHY